MTDLLTELEALAKEWEEWNLDSPDDEEEAQEAILKSAASRLRSLLAAEKARGPDPLLEQARAALAKYGGYEDDCPVLAALDARLGGKA